MNRGHERNILLLVEALLSGEYKHGKGKKWDLETGFHSFTAVIADVWEFPLNKRSPIKEYALPRDMGLWFSRVFGLERSWSFYASVSDNSQNFYAVSMLLLNAVPQSDRRAALEQKLFQVANVQQR